MGDKKKKKPTTASTTCLKFKIRRGGGFTKKCQQTDQREKLPSTSSQTANMHRKLYVTTVINPRKYFYLIEEIKNLAETLTEFVFLIHWIPSHIEHTSAGTLPIRGNNKADQLANDARVLATDSDTERNIDTIRDQLLVRSASLIFSLHNLLSSRPPLSFDGPSADDFSSADAMQDISFPSDILWHFPLVSKTNKQTNKYL